MSQIISDENESPPRLVKKERSAFTTTVGVNSSMEKHLELDQEPPNCLLDSANKQKEQENYKQNYSSACQLKAKAISMSNAQATEKPYNGLMASSSPQNDLKNGKSLGLRNQALSADNQLSARGEEDEALSDNEYRQWNPDNKADEVKNPFKTMKTGKEHLQNLNPCVVNILFTALLILMFLGNVDHGILPSASFQIKDELNLNNAQFGFIGSFVFFGLVIGSAGGTVIMKSVSARIVLAVTISCGIGALVLFTVTQNMALLLTSRFFCGIQQVFACIFTPVWADLFGATDKIKQMWLTAFLASGPLGVLLGYVLGGFFVQYSTWRGAFICQAFLFVPTLITILFVPKRYLEPDYKGQANADNKSEVGSKQNQSVNGEVQQDANGRIEKPSNQQDNQAVPEMQIQNVDMERQQSATEGEARIDDLQRRYSKVSNPPNDAENGVDPDLEETTWECIKNVLKAPDFVCLVVGISGLYFIITGLQYWISDYLKTVLFIEQKEVYIFYTVSCSTSTMLGVVVGGIFFNHLGGYNAPKSFFYCVITAFGAVAVAMPVPFLSMKWVVYSLTWFLLFLGAMVLPTATGILLNAVPEQRRTTANSLAQFAYNVFGYLPAPFMYGYISTTKSTKEEDIIWWSRAAMLCLMLETVWIFGFLFIARRFRLAKNAKMEFVDATNDQGELNLDKKGSSDTGAEVAIVGGTGPMIALKKTRGDSNSLYPNGRSRGNSNVSVSSQTRQRSNSTTSVNCGIGQNKIHPQKATDGNGKTTEMMTVGNEQSKSSDHPLEGKPLR